MEEMDSKVRRSRIAAWKKTCNEKLGRDHISSINGYVVAGCIFDIIDDIWSRNDLKIIKLQEEFLKQQYNVFVYRLIRYPPLRENQRFIGSCE